MSDEELLIRLHGDRKQINQAASYMVDHPQWRRSVKILLQKSHMNPDDFDIILFESIASLCSLVKKGKFNQESSLKTFFQGICKNVIRNKLAFKRRYVKRFVLMENDQLASREAYSPFEEASRERVNSLRELFKQVIEKLGESCKKGLIMKTQGFKDTEIADALNLSHGSTRKRLSKCREQLRKMGQQDSAFMNEIKSLI